MSELKPFCNSCGLCCAKVGVWVDQAKGLIKCGSRDPLVVSAAHFPHKYNTDGRCEKLGENNRCTIYDTRPDICNIDRIYEKFYKHEVTREDYYEQNKKACIAFGALGKPVQTNLQ